MVRKGIQSSFALGQKRTTVLVCLLVNSGFESSFLCGKKGNSVPFALGQKMTSLVCLLQGWQVSVPTETETLD